MWWLGRCCWHGDLAKSVTAQTFQFRRYPAERARRATAGPHWDDDQRWH
jgi:hypothetical protein